MTQGLGTLAALALAAALAACSSTPLPTAGAPVETRTPLAASGSGTTGPGSSTGAAPQTQVATVDLARAGAGAALLAAPSQRVVYFDFDSFVIRDEFKPLIEGHAKALAGSRSKKLVIEGHTDERGGREYNLALGQKRAEAVLRSLALLGASDGQLEAVSFGKERPAAPGSNEEAWAKNRRAELKDK
jgi:peptidoglycan-associated lipoprotein